MSQSTNPSPAAVPVAAVPVYLDTAKQIELLQFSIGRYDHYFDAVNNKANFWLAFDSFALGAVVVAYKDFVQPLRSLQPVPDVALYLDIEMGAFVVLSLVSIGLILLASFPFSSSTKRKWLFPKRQPPTVVAATPTFSVFYYDHVAARKLADFSSRLRQLSENELGEDYHSQAHQLAQGLAGKYRRLRQAGRVLFVQLGLLALLFLTFFLS